MRHKMVIVIVLALLLVCCGAVKETKQPHYEWNNGYCSDCGGRLVYVETGSKEHYTCDRCGKKYTFDKVMSRR